MELETPLLGRTAVEGVLSDPAERSRLVAYARTRFGIDSDAAEDLLQETALEVLRQRSLLSSPRGFIFTVFHARCCRFLRHQKARYRVFDRGDCETVEEAPSPSASEGIDSRLTVEQALEEISAGCRKLLLAYYVEGQTLREAADRTALAYSGVWKTITRCLQKLRRCLA
ncbi:MAG TPA: sigma-70 family RNA polymerase sigma factor [Thermoanaerobaculia bacterium]|nr:sigma-70 family RNA polymerase sigma factor [Thermoanaerobaculia bacterium]